MLRSDSYKKGIILSVVFNFTARLLGFAVSLVIAFYFGTKTDADIYFYCIAAIAMLAGFISSANSGAIIPEAMRIAKQESQENAQRFLNVFLYAYAALAAALAVLIAAEPVRLLGLISRFGPDELNRNLLLIATAGLLLSLQIVSAFLIETAASYKFFVVPMLSNILVNLAALAAMALFHGSLGTASVALGLACGNALQIGFLVLLFKKRLHWDFRPRFHKMRPQVLANLFYTQLGNAITAASAYIPLFMLSGLGQGIVSAFNYGKQLAETPNLFLTLQFSSVTGIKMNELNAAGDTRGLNAVFLRSANFLSFALVPAAFFLAAFSGEIIAVLYMRGNFGSKSAETTAMFLAYFALLLPMLGINTIIARLFMATQRIRDGMLVQIASNLLIIAFVFYGIKLAGPAGYPLALVMFYLLYVAAMAPVLRALYPWLEYGKTLSFLAKTAVINTAAFALIIRAKEQTAFLTPAGNIAFWFAVCASAALWLNHKFNFCPDARDFAGKVFGAMRK